MMSGRSRSYKDGLYRRLKDNAEAVNYLQAALEDSQAAFLVALKNVLDARNVAAVARASELDRVHIYRMLSEGGNPTLSSLEKILQALGMKLAISLEHETPAPAVSAQHVFHLSWDASSVRKQKIRMYGGYVQNARPCNSAPEPGIIGCEQMIGASAEVGYEDVPHPAFLLECEDAYEMAY